MITLLVSLHDIINIDLQIVSWISLVLDRTGAQPNDCISVRSFWRIRFITCLFLMLLTLRGTRFYNSKCSWSAFVTNLKGEDEIGIWLDGGWANVFFTFFESRSSSQQNKSRWIHSRLIHGIQKEKTAMMDHYMSYLPLGVEGQSSREYMAIWIFFIVCHPIPHPCIYILLFERWHSGNPQ